MKQTRVSLLLSTVCVLSVSCFVAVHKGRKSTSFKTQSQPFSIVHAAPSPRPTVEWCISQDEQDSQADHHDHSDARAWCLMQAMIRSDGQPEWQDWFPDPAAGMKDFDCGSTTPVQVGHPLGANPVQAAEILYSPAARDLICNTIAKSRKTAFVARLKDHANNNQPVNRSAPPDGHLPVIVKTIWAEVTDGGPGTELPVFDPPLTEKNTEPGHWTTKVRVTVPPPAGGGAAAQCKFKPPASYTPYPQNPQVALECFHSLNISKVSYDDLISKMKVLTPVYSTRGATHNSYYLMLLGFHIAVEKSPGIWLWHTYWWDAQAFSAGTNEASVLNDNPFFKSDPSDPWAHYIMQSIPKNGLLFNPYVEAQQAFRTTNNCATCHQSPTFHTACANKLYLESPPTPRTSLPSPPCDASHDKPLLTDSIWSLADSNVTILDPTAH